MESVLRFRRTLAILSSHARVGSIFASNTVEELHLREALAALPPPQRALVRSQGGPLSSRPCVARLRDSPSSRPSLSVCCSFVVSTCPSPCPPATACVAALATTGQLAVAGVLGRRGFAVESAIARICREGGQRTCSCGIWISDRSITSMPPSGGRGRWAVTVWWGPVGH